MILSLDVICYNCSEKGHPRRLCPQNESSAKDDESRGGHGGRGGPRGGRGGRWGRGGPRWGRGGRGGGTHERGGGQGDRHTPYQRPNGNITVYFR